MMILSNTDICVICNQDEFIDILYSLSVSSVCPFHEKFCNGADLTEDINTTCMKCINRYIEFMIRPDSKLEVSES